MSKMRKVVQFVTYLYPEDFEKLNDLKQALKQKSLSAVIRYLIRHYHENFFKDNERLR